MYFIAGGVIAVAGGSRAWSSCVSVPLLVQVGKLSHVNKTFNYTVRYLV